MITTPMILRRACPICLRRSGCSLYAIYGVEWVSEILAYVEDPEPYARELGTEKLAAIINEMDAR